MTEQELKKQIEKIKEGPTLVVAAVHGLDARALRFKSDPKKWCALEILGHLADIEVFYGYRMRQMIADKEPTIAPIDQDD